MYSNSHARALFVVRLRDIIILYSLAFIYYISAFYIYNSVCSAQCAI